MGHNSGKIAMTDGTRKKFVDKKNVESYRELGWWRGIPIHVIDQLEEMQKAKIKEVPECYQSHKKKETTKKQ